MNRHPFSWHDKKWSLMGVPFGPSAMTIQYAIPGEVPGTYRHIIPRYLVGSIHLWDSSSAYRTYYGNATITYVLR